VIVIARVVVALGLASLVVACSKSEPEPVKAEPAPSAPPSPSPSVTASATPSATSTATPGPLVLARGVRITHAPAVGPVADIVKKAREREKADGRDLVVYVGAKWCEPCQRFHKAAAAGELDTDFPQLTLLEFDLDEDRDRLESAGYKSQLIPLFVMPSADGRASENRFEGSVKGNAAVSNIAPRLRSLLAAR
jgi:thiol-disulfide isomerase/thioredoxin